MWQKTTFNVTSHKDDGGPQLLMGRLFVTGAITAQKDFEMGGSRLLRSGLVQSGLCRARHKGESFSNP